MLQFQTWCDVECDKYKMCDVEYGVVWTVVSWYVECYIIQDMESCEMWNCGDEECGTCNVLCNCCDVRCGK